MELNQCSKPPVFPSHDHLTGPKLSTDPRPRLLSVRGTTLLLAVFSETCWDSLKPGPGLRKLGFITRSTWPDFQRLGLSLLLSLPGDSHLLPCSSSFSSSLPGVHPLQHPLAGRHSCEPSPLVTTPSETTTAASHLLPFILPQKLSPLVP